jgi:single-strand DNA-binding protein
MSYELTGVLIEKYAEQQVSDKFKKREFVVETSNNGFTEQIKFQLVQDKTNLIESFNTGEAVKVSFNIRGNKWKDNYFVNLQAWRIEAEAANTGNSAVENTAPPTQSDLPPLPDEEDDLPF